jgi:hypothetical protein
VSDLKLPVFISEVRYYRLALAISWEFGAHLRRLGALVPDAMTDDGRALFLLTPERLEAAQNQVFFHKARQLKAEPRESVEDVEIAATILVSLVSFEAGGFSFEVTGSDSLHQGIEGSRCLKVQYPGAAEIRFVRLIRLRCGASLGQAENTEARQGSERAQQEVLWKLFE